ncbi:pyrroline-5-carboxylate reductase [Candidatus Poribacteria bacterium]|nr:pyrroline-5-carboxylate reductase [Candidatus Poribacteria bacterium]
MGSENIGFIGVGNMGKALLRGIIGSGLVSVNRVFASDLNRSKLENLAEDLSITAVKDNKDLVHKSDIIILAIKPNVIKAVMSEISAYIKQPKWLISIAAGIKTDFIESFLQKETPVVRVMPNTPAMVNAGMSALCAGSNASHKHLDKASQLLQAVGKVVIVEEKLMDAVTALSGSGPAFVFLIIEAFTDAGVKLGLSYSDAATMAIQTIFGASKIAMDTGEHPAILKNKVTSPGGTTAAGLYQLERNAVRSAFIDAISSAAARAKELSSD